MTKKCYYTSSCQKETPTTQVEEEYHAYIACYHNDENVVKFAKTLKEDLTSRGYKCVCEKVGELETSTIDTLCGNIETSRRVILLISSKKA